MTVRATIDLLRHGDTGYCGYRGRLDDPLSIRGWAQLRDAVHGRVWDRIVSSPLQRCAEFACDLSQQRGLPLRLDARWSEYCFGDWQGLSMTTLAAEQSDALAKFWADPVAHPPPGAEPFTGFRERVCAALDAAASAAVGARVLIITHGGVIRLVRCMAEGRTFGAMAWIEVAHASLHQAMWPPRPVTP